MLLCHISGMSERHSFTRDFTLSDYTKEQKRIHRAILAEQRRQGKLFPSHLLASSLPSLDAEEVSSGSESDSEYDDYYFLQPLPIRQRRILLRTAGVRKIDNDEKDECRDIRVSRNVCGCDCKLFCDPATCSCSQAGIQCQVDRLSFPCGCTKDGCSNQAGRIEFNPIRVRTHFIHTLMRLELERKDSECSNGNSAAAVTGCFSTKSSSVGGEIDVVGAIGEEGEGVSSENGDEQSDDSCSGASNDAGTSSGMKVLRSRLKAKKAEMIDLNMFNSNERGSCRDCQNTDMCNVMMHDVKFSMVTQQHRQQQQHQQHVISTTTLGSQPGYPGALGSQLQQQQHHLGLSSGISLLHPPPHQPQPLAPQHQQQQSQHMLLFNDGEEEVYQAENTTSMYFDIDDNSYSEMSDPSPDALDTNSFSGLTQSGFSGKFHMSQPHLFSSAGITTISNSSNGTVHSQSSSLSAQASLLTQSNLQAVHVNGTGDRSSADCKTLALEQHQSYDLMILPHAQQKPTPAAASQPLVAAPFLPAAVPSVAGLCVGSEGTMTSSPGLAPQNAFLTCPQMDTSLELCGPENGLILPGASSGFHNKLDHKEDLDAAVHPVPSAHKLEPSLRANHAYSSNSSTGTGIDYLSQQKHGTFLSPPSAVGFTSLTPTVVSDAPSFQAPQPVQQASSWSTSTPNPPLSECFVLGTPLEPPSLTSERKHPGEVCTQVCDQELSSGHVTLSPTSPCSPASTYTTMTTTTHDQLVAHFPGISSHVGSRTEHPNSAVADSAPAIANYPMASLNTESSKLAEADQNHQNDLAYSSTSSAEPCVDLSLTCDPGEVSRSSCDPQKDNFLIEALPPASENTSPPVTTELPDTPVFCQGNTSPSILLSSTPSSFVPPTAPSSSATANCLIVVRDHTTINQVSSSTEIVSQSESKLQTLTNGGN